MAQHSPVDHSGAPADRPRRRGRLAAAALATGVLAAGFLIAPAPAQAASVPTITRLSITKGTTAGGTSVTITGTGFSTVDSTASNVKFGTSNAAEFMVVSDTQITAKTAAGTGANYTGLVDVVVTNATGPSVPSVASKFAYRAPLTAAVPASTRFNPTGGSSVVVTITGYTLGESTTFSSEKITAKINNVAATVSYLNTSQVKLTVPAGTPSATAATVALFHDSVTGTNDTTNAKYAAVITKLSTAYGPLTGVASSANLTVTGKGFTGATAWKFGANAATCSVVSDTSATCSMIPPQHATTPVPTAVTVSFTPANSTPFGTTSGAAYTYTDLGTPIAT